MIDEQQINRVMAGGPRRWKAGERAPWGRRKKHRDTLIRAERRWARQMSDWLRLL